MGLGISRTPCRAHKRKRPESRGAAKIQPASASGSNLGRLDLQELAGTCDGDRPSLHRLRNLAHEVDVEEPVLQARAVDLDIVGELEATLEGSRGNALVEHLAGLFLGVGLLLAADRQLVLLRLDREISVGEAGDCDRDAIGVLTRPLDIIGRIARHRAFHTAELVEHGKHTVEADGYTVEGSKIECTHSMTSCLSDMRTVRPQGPTFRITQPYGLRVSYLRTHPSLRKGLNRIFPGYHGVFTSRLRDNEVKIRNRKDN